MANPQIEKGHTRIANEIIEQISKTDLNGTQMRIVMVIWRYTYGFRRKGHEISLTFLSESINTRKSHVDKELTTLIDRKIVNVVGIGPRRGRILSFNKNYDEWQGRPTDKITQPLPPKRVKGTKVDEDKKKPRQQKMYQQDSTFYKMAVYFHEKVSATAKEAEVEHLIAKSNLQKWADDFRKLIEIDGVDKRLAKEVMDWIPSDNFWRTNVLSAKKLREKFTELAIKMKSSKKPRSQKETKQVDPREKDIEFQKFLAEGGNPDDFDWGS
jgi:phage replication O-like protein O